MRISNIQYQISNAKSKIVIAGNIFVKPILHSQAGVAQLALVMLLLAGVAVGTYVVQNRTNISPNAEEGSSCNEDTYYCEGDKKIHKTGGYMADNGECVYDYQDAGSCQDDSDSDESEKNCQGEWRDGRCYTPSSNSSCNEDTTYCDNGNKIHKTGGYWDGKQCVYDFKNEGSCGSASSEGDSDSSQEACQKISGATWKDGRCFTPASSEGQKGPGDSPSSSSTSYDQGDCRDGAQVFKDGYTWITYCTKVCSKNSDCPKNTTDGAVNPETSNWCYGFNGGKAPRCMMLVQSDNKEVNDQSRKTSNSKAVEEIKSTIAQGGDPNPAAAAATQSSSADFKAKIDAQNTQRGSLVSELATVLNNAGSGNSSLTGAVNRAQSLITSAASSAAACYTGTDKPLNDSCDATTQAANDIAVAASRVALFDAVAAGVPNTCVKVDMAVGANTSNSIIEVAPAENASNLSRLFMCRGAESATGKKDGDIKWRVRDNNGSLQEVSQTSLTQLGLQNGQKQILTIPENFIVRRNNAAALSSQPAFAGTTTLNFNETSSTAWKEVAVSNCLSNCSSFPSGAACYQKGTTNEYNCNGANQTQSTVSEKKNLAKNATCNDNKECRSGQCNPGTSKCL